MLKIKKNVFSVDKQCDILQNDNYMIKLKEEWGCYIPNKV